MSTAAVVETIDDKLKEHGATKAMIDKIKALGADTPEDLASLTEEELVTAGLKPVKARKLLASVQPAPPVAEAASLGTVAFDGVLPSVPDDSSWLESLKAGGILKVEESTVISSVRAGLANSVGLYDVPAKLVKAMEKFADDNDEQVDPVFFKLREQLTRRSYAEVFEAIDGLNGNYVTEARKKQLLDRIDEYLWPALMDFYNQLKGWQETWMQQGANPAMMMAAIASMGSGAPLPTGMMQPPDTGTLRDYADAFNDAVNRVFAGTGVQIAAALAYDAAQIKKTLEDPGLPALIGAANRDQMLKQLGVSVSSTYPRLEVNLTRFVLSIMDAKNVPAGNEELQYFGTLNMLGAQIPLADLSGRGTATGIGGNAVEL